MDPDFDDEIRDFATLFNTGNTIELGIDAIRPPEALFQPHTIGIDQVNFLYKIARWA